MDYRIGFLRELASRLDGDLYVFAGNRAGDGSTAEPPPDIADGLERARNIGILRGPLSMYVQLGILKWLGRIDPDVLILEGNPRLLSNWLAAAWMRRRRRPVIGWGLWPPDQKWMPSSISENVWRLFASRFDAFVMYSSQHAEDCVQLGLDQARVFVAPNATTPSPPLWPTRSEHRHRLTVIYVGRLQQRKRVDLLIRACASIEPSPVLWIVGDGPERLALEQLAATAFPPTTFWGARAGTELEALFLESDLFVLPGTGGLAVQHAMYHGLPVAVAEADGTQGDLIDKGNGWLLRSADLDSLVETMQAAADNPSRLRSMGVHSLEIVRDKVNVATMVDGFMSALSAIRTSPN